MKNTETVLQNHENITKKTKTIVQKLFVVISTATAAPLVEFVAETKQQHSSFDMSSSIGY